MRLPTLLLIILFAVNLLTDIYIRQTIVSRIRSRKWPLTAFQGLWVLLTLLFAAIAAMPVRGGSDAVLDSLMWMLFIYISFYIPKYIFVVFDLIASIPKLFHRKRLKPLTMIGFILALVAFLTIWWGALINRHHTQIVERDIMIDNLPEAFEGYKIAQFSDFHVGTYNDDTSFVRKVVAQINGLNPDLIVFTGDLVSRRTSELLPFVAPLGRLSATDGVYSVLGNHDYGDYYNWKSKDERLDNIRQMISLQESMGWNMLNNAHATLRRGNDSIALIGVENVGDPPFATYGSLEDAYPDISDKEVKILLSHNPAHWVDDIADHKECNIALTLAGHTHAMQMTLLGKSPASMRYKTWGGLYSDRSGDHQLYVNIGLGTVGIPMRIGATPEITLLTLRRKK